MNFLIFIIISLATIIESAKVLIAIPFAGKSHYISNRNIGLELARRGHEVYVITTFAEQESPKNYHEIVVEKKETWELLGMEELKLSELVNTDFASFLMFLHYGGVKHSEWVLNTTRVQHFLSEDHKFDLVICEVFFHDSFYLLAHHYNAPLVLVTTFGNSFRTNYFMRNPLQLSTVLHEYGKEKEPESVWGRLKNLYFCFCEMTVLKLYFSAKYEAVAKKYIPNLREPVPSLAEVTENASLVLMNSHFSTDGAIAYLPNFIEVGGLHLVNSNKSLPSDLQRLLDAADGGVILMSFGSVLKGKDLPDSKRNVFMHVFGKLKQKVILKWEQEDLPGKPTNVEIRQWIPQKEILAHPNVKLFITHGGLLGLQEATYFGVPLLGIPVFGDQLNNIVQARKLGYAEVLEMADINEETFEKLLVEMLSNNIYQKNAKAVSKKFVDRPMSALDTAMYWIEYVIRHKAGPTSKYVGLEMNILAFYQIDLIIGCVVTLVLIFVGLKRICNMFKKRSNIVSKTKKMI